MRSSSPATAAPVAVADDEAANLRTSQLRFWEIDLARTTAIAMMVTYHVGYDIDMLAPDIGIQPLQGGWRGLQVATGSFFLFLAGLSFMISDASAIRRGLDGRARLAKHARRGAQVIGFGLIISLVTWVALDERYVRFGILHAIGASIVLAPIFARLRIWAAPLGVAIVVAGLSLRDVRSDVPGVLILGIKPNGSAGVDYYPLLPWFGPFLLGMAAASVLYPRGRPGSWTAQLPSRPPGWMTLPGRHSLGIYLIHQPILIAAIAGILAVFGVDWSWPS